MKQLTIDKTQYKKTTHTGLGQIFALRKSAVSCQLSNVSCPRNRGFTPTPTLASLLVFLKNIISKIVFHNGSKYDAQSVRAVKTMPRLVSGFTLVELLIVIGVFVLLTGTVLSNYRNYDSNALFANASENVVLALRQAQVYGAGAKGNSSICTGGTTLFDCSYGVHFSTNATENNGITVFADLNSDRVFETNEDIGFQSLSVKWANTISITSLSCGSTLPCSSGVANITFRRPNPDAFIAESVVNPANSFDFITIGLTDSKSGRTAIVTVTKAGQISIQ
jgi:type II secretory pathway pseudopilin PulG